MKAHIARFSLLALLAGVFMQVGAQLFAVSTIVQTTSAAPPASLAIYRIDYPYDSSAFWELIPSVNLALFVVAFISNWRTAARWWIGLGFACFVVCGIYQSVVVGPLLAELLQSSPGTHVDARLVEIGRQWLQADVAAFAIAFAGGVCLMVAAMRRSGRTAVNPPASPATPPAT